mgnify:CR=1 FL=1|jgi:hypothetical protein
MAEKTLLIGYDLNKEVGSEGYNELIAAIKTVGAWWHHLDSTWLVKTHKSAVEVRDTLLGHLDSNDELLVIDVTSQPRAWTGFNASGSKWLKETYA